MSASAPLSPSCDPEDHCITCGDEGVAMRVLEIDAGRALALCEDGAGSRSTIEIALVDDVAPGDALLAHAGVALVRLQEERA